MLEIYAIGKGRLIIETPNNFTEREKKKSHYHLKRSLYMKLENTKEHCLPLEHKFSQEFLSNATYKITLKKSIYSDTSTLSTEKNSVSYLPKKISKIERP